MATTFFLTTTFISWERLLYFVATILFHEQKFLFVATTFISWSRRLFRRRAFYFVGRNLNSWPRFLFRNLPYMYRFYTNKIKPTGHKCKTNKIMQLKTRDVQKKPGGVSVAMLVHGPIGFNYFLFLLVYRNIWLQRSSILRLLVLYFLSFMILFWIVEFELPLLIILKCILFPLSLLLSYSKFTGWV